MTVLWLALAILSLALALWPFGLYQASLAMAAKIHRFPELADAGTKPALPAETFAICLCAYNEAGCIRQKTEDLLALREAAGGDLDILIYVDCADDGTADILREYEDRIRLFVSPERHGKTHGMNMLVQQTDASIVLFTDANVLITPDAIAILKRYFADPQIGCVCSNLQYVNPGDSATANVGSAFWRFNEWSKSLETATGSVIGADGSLFAIRRRLHHQVPRGLIDDLHISLGILLQGYRVVRAPEMVAFETHTTVAEDEFRRKIRITCECMHVHFDLWPNLRKMDFWNLYKYIGHRLLRWVGGYLFVFSGIFTILALGSMIGWMNAVASAGIALAAFALLIRLNWGPALKIWNAVLAFAGASIGVWRAFKGERAITWSVPASARQAVLASDR